ncbi:Serine/threonine-protein phosphatase 7 long form homolog, partial [Linum perenne]
ELVTALIERWRPETNTFHLVPGEATITLEDVEVLTGLPTTGRPVIVSPDERPVTDICEQWLGVQPPPNAIQGKTVRVSWVKRLFDRLPDGATAEVITYHARAYTWVLVAGVLLADRNGDHIQVHLLQLIGDPRVASTYSWGSAVLAWLYKVMGRAAFFSAGSMRGTGDIGGFTLLVELWALERFPRIREWYIHGGAPPPPPPTPSWMTPFRGALAGHLSLSDISIGWPCTWRIYVHALFRGSLTSVVVFLISLADVIVDIRIPFILRAMASFVIRVIRGDIFISRQSLLINLLPLGPTQLVAMYDPSYVWLCPSI